MKVYALTLKGKPVPCTVADTHEDCWSRSFDVVSARLGPEWRSGNWMDWNGSIEQAEGHGYVIQQFGLRGGKRARAKR
jgi:hypothetical protein